MENAVIYARYSSHSQNETSIEGQLKVCYEYAERNGFRIIKEYIDRALSGTTDKRPDFLQMIEDSKKRAFTHVIVYQFDRFAREKYDSVTYKRTLKKNGVKVVSVKENISDDASGVLMESVLEGMAEYYSKELSQKVRRGMDINARKGKYLGGSKIFGFDITEDKSYVVNEYEAKWVISCFEMYVERKTMNEIAKYLNDNLIKTKYGSNWDERSIGRLIKNNKYIGEYEFNGEIFKDAIPRIVSQDLWDKAQDLLNQRKHKAISYKFEVPYILTGKLFCAECGGPIAGSAGTGKKKKYFYYRCNNTIRNGKLCELPYFKKDIIEETVVKLAKSMFTDSFINDVVDRAMKEFSEENISKEKIKQLKKEQNDVKKQIDKFTDLLICQDRNIDIIMDRIDQLKIKDAQLKESIALEESRANKIDRQDLIDHLYYIRDHDLNSEKNIQAFIDTCIDRIYINKDKKIAVFFKLSDGNIQRECSRNVSLVELKRIELSTS